MRKIALILMAMNFLINVIYAETLDPNSYIDLMESQIDAIRAVDVKYCIVDASAKKGEPFDFGQFTYSDLINSIDALEYTTHPLHTCSLTFFHYIRKNDREFFERIIYSVNHLGKLEKQQMVYWNNPKTGYYNLYYPDNHQCMVNLSGFDRIFGITYENFIKYQIAMKGNKELRYKYADYLRDKITLCKEEAGKVELEASFSRGKKAKVVKGTEEKIKVVLSKEFNYLPVKISFWMENLHEDVEDIEYKKFNEVYFPVRLIQRISDPRVLMDFHNLYVVDETNVKVNEGILDSVFDYQLPDGCMICDAKSKRTYVKGRPKCNFCVK